MRSITLAVAGQSLSVQTDADEQTIAELETRVSERLRELHKVGQGASTARINLLAGLTFVEELLAAEAERDAFRDEAESMRRERDAAQAEMAALRQESERQTARAEELAEEVKVLQASMKKAKEASNGIASAHLPQIQEALALSEEIAALAVDAADQESKADRG